MSRVDDVQNPLNMFFTRTCELPNLLSFPLLTPPPVAMPFDQQLSIASSTVSAHLRHGVGPYIAGALRDCVSTLMALRLERPGAEFGWDERRGDVDERNVDKRGHLEFFWN